MRSKDVGESVIFFVECEYGAVRSACASQLDSSKPFPSFVDHFLGGKHTRIRGF